MRSGKLHTLKVTRKVTAFMDGTIIIGDKPPVVNDSFQDDPLTLSEELTLELILNHTKKRGYCFAHNEKLAAKRKKSIPTITRHVSKFVKRGYLIFRRVGNKRWLYPGINDYPMIRQRLPDDDPIYTKDSKATEVKSSFVCEQTGIEDSHPEQSGGTTGNEAITAPTCPPTPPVSPPRQELAGTEVESLREERIKAVHSKTTSAPPVAVSAVHSVPSGTHPTELPHQSTANQPLRRSPVVPTELNSEGKASACQGSNPRSQVSPKGLTGGGCVSEIIIPKSIPDTDTTSPTGSDNPGVALLIENGVESRQAFLLGQKHTLLDIQRAATYLKQRISQGHTIANPAGFLVAALTKGYCMKLLDTPPERIAARHARVRTQAENEVYRAEIEARAWVVNPFEFMPKRLPPLQAVEAGGHNVSTIRA